MNYIKKEISKDPKNILYSINPMTIHYNVKAKHPNITTTLTDGMKIKH